jgi:type I restriction enzyme S subunit
LGDVIAESQPGFASGQRDPNGVIQLRMNNVDTRGNMLWNEFIRVPADQATIEKYRLKPGDIVFNNTNSTELVGKSAIFKNHEEAIVYSNHFTRLRVKPNVADASLVTYWLISQWHAKTFEKICNRWIGQSAVKTDKLFALEIPLPPLNEQRRIASRLNEQLAAVEAARKAAEEQLQAARQLPSAYLRQVFESDEAREWEFVNLRDICISDGQYGTSEKATELGLGVPVLRMGNLVEGNINWSDLKYIELSEAEEKKYLLENGDVIFNRTNSVELVGKTAVFNGERKAVFASYLIRFRLLPDKANPHFVAAYINSQSGRKFIEDNMARAIGQANVSASKMHRMPIPLPSLERQNQIMQELKSKQQNANNLIRNLESQLAEINRLPASLLREAFTGGV